MDARIISILLATAGLPACATPPPTEIVPPISSEQTPAANPTWSYKLTPIELSQNAPDGSFTIWHARHGVETYPSEALCLEAAAEALDDMGGEAWNLKAKCLSSPPTAAPLAIMIADDIELEQ